MPNFRQGIYEVKNANKYVGKGKPRYRSGWEMTFMNFCDNNDNVINWASEPVRIPYRHPITGKMTMYVPDFIVVYRGPHNTTKAELIEIKPRNQSILAENMKDSQRATIAVNYSKWQAATRWAKQNGLSFRVLNESDIFQQGRKK
jgi:TnsA endonuclease N terminal